MPRYRRRGPKPTTDARSVDERLEALVRERNRDRVERIIERILDDLAVRPEPAPWIAAARTLNERLIISDLTFIFFVDLFVQCLLDQAAKNDVALVRLNEQMSQIERAHGLRAGETFEVAEAPADWLATVDAWEDRARVIVGASLRQYGHADIATLQESSPVEFERRAIDGHEEFWSRFDDVDE